MKKHEYRAIHSAVKTVFGKPKICELCKNKKKSKRLEWSNKDHKYKLDRKDWWVLCGVCHWKYDAEKFGRKPVWNKGMVLKPLPFKKCNWCGKKFQVKRKEQIMCSRLCSGQRNGNRQKGTKKPRHLIEKGLVKL